MRITILQTFAFLLLLPLCLFAQSDIYNMSDYTFGKRGKVTTNADGNSYSFGSVIQSVMVQRNGKIITAGNTEVSPTYDVLLARYLPDGSIDSSFGGIGYRHYGHKDSYIFDYLVEAQLQSDGKIVAIGFTSVKDYLIRFLTNGDIDSSFGQRGVVVLKQSANSLDIDSNDNIVVCENYGIKNNLYFALQRFAKNGKADSAFGNNNFSSLLIGEQSISPAFNVHGKWDKKGNIVVGGTWYHNGNVKEDLIVLHFKANGSIDSSFNKTGRLLISTVQGALLSDILVQPDNKIVVGGTTKISEYGIGDFLLIRINPDGSFDNGFGENGFVTTDFSRSIPSRGDDLTALCIQQDNKIIAVGESSSANNKTGHYIFSLCRYNTDGSTDTSFGYLGRDKTNFGDNYSAVATDAAIQPNGKIVLAGYHVRAGGVNTSGDIAIARYNKERKTVQDFTTLRVVKSRYSDSVVVFPNPVKNNLHIDGLPSGKKMCLTIADYNGNIKMQAYSNNRNVDIDISSYKAGHYILMIELYKDIIVRKFLKE